MNPQVDVASAADVAAIAALDGLPPTNARLVGRDVGADTRCCLVARVEGHIVGYVSAALHLDEAEILDVVVDPEHRRRGVATQLLTDLLDHLAHRGVRATTLEVREDDVGTRTLYGHLGFVVEGRRPGYYADGDAALIMWQRT